MKNPGENPTPKITDPAIVKMLSKGLEVQNLILEEMRNDMSTVHFFGLWETLAMTFSTVHKALESVKDPETRESIGIIRGMHRPHVQCFADLGERFILSNSDSACVTEKEKADAIAGYQSYIDDLGGLI